jgi:5-formyltetrahydrofolate cyclo-ligase
MVAGPFGALVPARPASWLTPVQLIVPLVASTGRAIGWAMAAGSTTARWPGCARAARCAPSGWPMAAQELPAIPRDATDQQLDAIVTEAGIRPA